MSINRINTKSYINAYNSNSNKCVEQTNNVNKATDRVEISSLAKTLQNSANDEVGMSKRVEEIKAQINNGTYNVDARLTAKSLLDSMKGTKF